MRVWKGLFKSSVLVGPESLPVLQRFRVTGTTTSAWDPCYTMDEIPGDLTSYSDQTNRTYRYLVPKAGTQKNRGKYLVWVWSSFGDQEALYILDTNLPLMYQPEPSARGGPPDTDSNEEEEEEEKDSDEESEEESDEESTEESDEQSDEEKPKPKPKGQYKGKTKITPKRARKQPQGTTPSAKAIKRGVLTLSEPVVERGMKTKRQKKAKK
jgi:hypothetical protein